MQQVLTVFRKERRYVGLTLRCGRNSILVWKRITSVTSRAIVRKKNIDEDKINREVMNLAIEMAQKIHSTGVDNWLRKMESQKELPFTTLN